MQEVPTGTSYLPAAKAIYYFDSPKGRLVLLLHATRQTPHGPEEYLDCPGPGGRLEEGETAQQALQREIKEEIGVEITTAQIGECIGTDSWPHGLTGQEIRAQIYPVAAKNQAIHLGEAKYIRYQWLTAAELGAIDANPESKRLMIEVASQ